MYAIARPTGSSTTNSTGSQSCLNRLLLRDVNPLIYDQEDKSEPSPTEFTVFEDEPEETTVAGNFSRSQVPLYPLVHSPLAFEQAAAVQ